MSPGQYAGTRVDHGAGELVIVTGGAGFIGSNLVHELNSIGETNILIVDHLSPGSFQAKRINLEGAKYAASMDKVEFRRALAAGDFGTAKVGAILHQGACSNTLETDERYMMDNNFVCSQEILDFATAYRVPLVYASTAAVYGLSQDFAPELSNEKPLNLYGRSKLRFDNLVRQKLAHSKELIESTVVGLRYFNVYGPREQHKGRMASVLHHFTQQLKSTGVIRLFRGTGGYPDGEQRRDFVSVQDIARINLFFAGLLPESPRGGVQTIVNAGTGVARTFHDVAAALMQVHGPGRIEYIPLPADLQSQYQHFTQADISGLRAAGYRDHFCALEEGVRRMVAPLLNMRAIRVY